MKESIETWDFLILKGIYVIIFGENMQIVKNLSQEL